jgi:hypothetical protein
MPGKRTLVDGLAGGAPGSAESSATPDGEARLAMDDATGEAMARRQAARMHAIFGHRPGGEGGRNGESGRSGGGDAAAGPAAMGTRADAMTPADVATAAYEQRGGGAALDGGVRQAAEPHLGPLGDVRVHGDAAAATATEALGARAMAIGSDVFLGAGESPTDVKLMGHELTHVAQQSGAARPAVQAKIEVGAADHPAEHEADRAAEAIAGGAAAPLIVGDGAPAAAGQLGRTAFLARLRAFVETTAHAALAPEWSAADCPYIAKFFARHATSEPAGLERLARRYAGVDGPTTIDALLTAIATRLGDQIGRWKRGADVAGELAAQGLPEAAESVRAAGPAQAPLGAGASLDPGTAARMSGAFGESFGDVRVHSDDRAAARADAQGASAYTVGSSITFARGKYQPGTMEGDALLAHELAHVVQQRGASGDPRAAAATGGGGGSAEHEHDADRAATGVMARLWGGVKAATSSVAVMLKSDFALQRCPKSPDIKPIAAVDPAAPSAAMLHSAGDWFHVEWRTGPDRVAIRYEGGYRLRGNRVTDNELVVPVPDPKLTGLSKPYDPRVLAEAGRVVFDVFGDASYRLEVRDQPQPSDVDFDERGHDFVVSLNGKRQDDHLVFVALPKPGDKPDVAPEALAREQVVATKLALLGDEFEIKARRFGDTKQVQLRIAGPASGTSNPADVLVTLAEAPEKLTLTPVVNNGRDVQFDLDGNGKPDAFFVHTAAGTTQGKQQDRTHILRQFDADGVFLGREHVFSALGPPVAIPKAQSEADARPDIDKEAPTSRAPLQGDAPGELPENQFGPGGVREVRIDGDGDRHKELVLRFKPGTAAADHSLPVAMHVTMIETGETHDASFTLKDADPAAVWARVTRVADGYTPTEIMFGNSQTLTVGLPVQTPAQWTYVMHAAGAPLSFAFAAPKTKPSDLVVASDKPAVHGTTTSVDAVLGEYGDKFRFFVDKNPTRTTFGVRPVIGNDPLGGREVPVESWVNSVAVLSGDPYAVTLDLNGDGKPDAKIYDRMTAPAHDADPAALRSHVLTFTGLAFPYTETRTFAAEGQLKSQDGFVPGLQLQSDQGDYAELQSRLDGTRTATVKKCHDQGLLSDKVFEAWQAMLLAMAPLPLTPIERVRAMGRVIAPAVLGAATSAVKAFHDALTAETKGKPGADVGEGKSKRVNPYTATKTWKSDKRQEGAGVALPGAITAANWSLVARHYEAVGAGFEQWIQHLLDDKYGKDSQEAQSHRYVVGLENKMKTELDGKDPIRIPAVFTPDEKPDEFAPLMLFAYHDDDTWYLKDITNPKEDAFKEKFASKDPLPPPQLFDKLNYFKHFPKGQIHYRVPGGADGRVKTTSDKPWHWYLSWIGLGIVAIGAGLMTFGTGTVATIGAVAVAGGSFAGAAAAAGDMIDEHRHGHLSAGTVVIDVAQIVGGLAGGTSVLGGRLIKVAAEADAAVTAGVAGSSRLAGNWAKLAGLAQRAYLPVNVAGAGADTVTLLCMTDDVAKAITAIQADDKMSAGDKTAALARVFGQFLVLGAITAMSVKGTIADVFAGRPEIEIINVGGEPMAVRAGTRPELRPSIGKPSLVGGDGSITQLGKDRLAALDGGFRAKLLKLDQSSMGRILAQSDDVLDRLAGLSVDELRKLGRLSESTIAKLAPLDGLLLRGIIEMDPRLIDKLATNLDLDAFKKVITLPDAALARFGGLDAPIQQGLGKARRETIQALLGDPKAVFDHLPFEHTDWLEHLAAMPAAERAKLVQHMAGRGDAVAKVLWHLDPETLQRLSGMLDHELDALAGLGADALKKLAPLHALQLKNLASLTPAELAEVAKLDARRIERLSQLEHGELVNARPFSEAAVDARLADKATAEAHVGAELAGADVHHHLRETNFADRGTKDNTGGGQIKLGVPGKPAVAIDAPTYVRLEPIPAGAPGGGTPTTIVRVEVEGVRSDNGAVLTGDVVQNPSTAGWETPAPGQPHPRVTVETSAGKVPFTDVEHPPPGTRVQLAPKEVASRGFAGGHTRDAVTRTQNTYGDFVKTTSDVGIKFKIPGHADPIEAAAVRMDVTLPSAKTKPIKDPKAIFEKPSDLDAFEAHAQPYLAAKLEATRARPPGAGDRVSVDVPVQTTGGVDAVMRVEVPWRVHDAAHPSAGQVDIQSWWLAENNFAKGSPFNP